MHKKVKREVSLTSEFKTINFGGASMCEDPYLLPFYKNSSNNTVPFVFRNARYFNNSSFVVYTRYCQCDKKLLKPLQTKWERLRKVIEPYEQDLLSLYFQFVDKVYPVIDKKDFYQTYFHQNGEINVTILAGMLALGCMYWKLYTKLCVVDMPDKLDSDLWICCRMFLEHDLVCKGSDYENIQALLLYSQKRTPADGFHEQTVIRLRIGELVSMAYSLGLHMDCSKWDIPEAERQFRRRLFVCVYNVEVWSALLLGHPSMLNLDISTSLQLESDNKFLQMFSNFTVLAQRVSTQLYPNQQANLDDLLALNLLAETTQLKETYSLSMDEENHGMLILSYLTLESLIFRILLNPKFEGKYRPQAAVLVNSIFKFFQSFKHEHIFDFWHSSCRLMLTTIGHLVFRFQAQATEPERNNNLRAMKSWMFCLESLGISWNEGLYIVMGRLSTLFYKGVTDLHLPLSASESEPAPTTIEDNVSLNVPESSLNTNLLSFSSDLELEKLLEELISTEFN